MRAYSHQGHGPRADQIGRIHISDFRTPRTISIAKCSRSIHLGHFETSNDELSGSVDLPIADTPQSVDMTALCQLETSDRFELLAKLCSDDGASAFACSH